jgi:hypothetical protein
MHDAVRDILYAFAKKGLLNVSAEDRGLLGSADRRRPGDLVIRNWAGLTSVAVDLTFVRASDALSAEVKKFAKLGYKDPERFMKPIPLDRPPPLPSSPDPLEAAALKMSFCPAAFEYFGGIGKWAEVFLRRVAEALAVTLCSTEDKTYTYLRRFVNRHLAFNISSRILSSLKNQPDPVLRTSWAKARAATRHRDAKRDKLQRTRDQLSASTGPSLPPPIVTPTPASTLSLSPTPVTHSRSKTPLPPTSPVPSSPVLSPKPAARHPPPSALAPRTQALPLTNVVNISSPVPEDPATKKPVVATPSLAQRRARRAPKQARWPSPSPSPQKKNARQPPPPAAAPTSGPPSPSARPRKTGRPSRKPQPRPTAPALAPRRSATTK